MMTIGIGHGEVFSSGNRPRKLIEDSRIGRSIELLMLGFYCCLIYKQASIGVGFLCMLLALGVFIEARFGYIFCLLGIFSILYLAMSTTTAFLVSFDRGIYRTLQFVVMLGAFVTISNYLGQIGEKRREHLFLVFSVLSVLMFAHMILYHLYTGHITTWKYLYDTKTTISIVLLLVFVSQDAILGRTGKPLWWLLLCIVFFLILCSGERKAYILFFMLFIFSVSSTLEKVSAFSLGLAAIIFFTVTSSPDSYIARQIDSLFSEKREMHISEFYQVEAIGDHSDLIRDFVNRNAWQIFLENPLTGVGANGYAQWAEGQFVLDGESDLSTNVHGEINRVPVEGGIVGIFVALSYMALLAYAVLKDFRRSGLFRSKSLSRSSLYIFCFLALYLYTEALDTLMLSIIVLFGFHMAKASQSTRRNESVARLVQS